MSYESPGFIGCCPGYMEQWGQLSIVNMERFVCTLIHFMNIGEGLPCHGVDNDGAIANIYQVLMCAGDYAKSFTRFFPIESPHPLCVA